MKKKGYILKSGTVLSMDHAIGNVKKADVVINGSTIEAIGNNLQLDESAYHIIDASEHIIMPGLVDTHRHMWESLVRTAGTNWSLPVYLQNLYYGGLGSRLRPQDSYIANLLGSLEALHAGVTTVLDWSMPYSPEHTDELIRGLQEAGIRSVFALGVPGETEYWNRDSRLVISDAERVKKQYFTSQDQLLTMGLAIRGSEFSHWDTTVTEIGIARQLEAICSMHIGFGNWGAVDHSVTKLYEAGLLGPDLNMVHGNKMMTEEYKMLADTGASLSVTPEVEMMMGHGYPATGFFLEQGGMPSLGVDVVTSTGGDLFAQMKFMLQAERARVNEEILNSGNMPGELNLLSQQVLEFATVGGAKALQLDSQIGQLTPGKQADIIMISTSDLNTDLNLFPVIDPIGAVVQFTNPSNVDTVFVGGRLMKQHGQLVGVDIERVRRLVSESRAYLDTQYVLSDAGRVIYS
ncbi:amidohydrolase family protein [Paenibacillus kyungheensis]|uniref:Amidohydrolase family protein n=1 Tax=Paenibacillus kyungheensis TaxID=1452732 RepID=A0AAX3M1U1_9BACL|nr:amidohydrolase family protein [Paenibacillus kyungheensis]WCT55619.1 amidohydrolase family protein [Paenibacillus kyungheensis]